MHISSSHKELFRIPATADMLTLLQLLFDSKDLTEDLALALLRTIHKELSIHQIRDRSGYKHYAETIESLRYHVPDLFRQIVSVWKTNQNAAPEEWFTHGSQPGKDNSNTGV